MGAAHDLRRHELERAAHGDGDAVGVEAEVARQPQVDDLQPVLGQRGAAARG